MKYDVETFCDDILATLTANLNAKISAINSEKNDGITLASVESDAYFFQELNSKAANFNPYVLYSIEELGSDNAGPYASVKPTLHVIAVLSDNGEDADGCAKRLLRYQRALKEVFEENWTQNAGSVKINLSSLVPVQFSLMNSAESFRAIGVSITGSIG
jgi:hypothetical protein